MTDRNVTLTVANVRGLADRLFARGRSLFGTSTKTEKADLVIAARCLWQLTADFDPDASITIPADSDGPQGK